MVLVAANTLLPGGCSDEGTYQSSARSASLSATDLRSHNPAPSPQTSRLRHLKSRELTGAAAYGSCWWLVTAELELLGTVV